jgi:hypothetical protein
LPWFLQPKFLKAVVVAGVAATVDGAVEQRPVSWSMEL